MKNGVERISSIMFTCLDGYSHIRPVREPEKTTVAVQLTRYSNREKHENRVLYGLFALSLYNLNPRENYVCIKFNANI